MDTKLDKNFKDHPLPIFLIYYFILSNRKYYFVFNLVFKASQSMLLNFIVIFALLLYSPVWIWPFLIM